MPAKPTKPPAKKKRKTRTTDPEQSARFLETAKNLDADETGEAFERAMDVLAPKPKSK